MTLINSGDDPPASGEDPLAGQEIAPLDSVARLLKVITPEAEAVAARILSDENDRKDAVQETQIAAYLRHESRGDPTNPKAWARRVAFNKCVDVIRKQGKTFLTHEFSTESRLPDGLLIDRDFTQDVEDKELLQRLQAALADERHSEVLRLWIYEGLKGNEIARMLQVSEATVSRDKQRIIQRFIDLHPEYRPSD